MVVRSLKRITPKVWIPPIYSANYKVTVERSNGTIDDITDILLYLKIEDGVTEGIGNFEFEIPNPNETYTNAWTGMEIFRYYSDYATGDATTLRFRGRVEKPSNRNNNLLVTGRSESLFVHGQNISKDFVNQDAGFMIKDLFDTYGESRFDTSSVDISTGVILTLTFLDLPFWEAVQSICIAAGYDCYVSANLIVEYFLEGSRLNTGEAIVHDYNLVEVGDFAPDLKFVKNQIRVLGGTIDGVQVMYTSDNLNSQSTNGIRREVISDDGITTREAAKELAAFVLSNNEDPPITGDIKGTLLASIQPGENIRLSSPAENIPPADYKIITYVHKIGDEGLYTIVKVNRESRRVSHVLKERIQREHRKTSSSLNPDDLNFAETELFNADIGLKNNTEIVDGVLKLVSGQSTGTWISPPYGPADGRIFSKFKVDLVGALLTGITIEISYDGGVNHQTVSKSAVTTLGVGQAVVVRLTLTTGSEIDSQAVQYSMTT